jgi:hypothetical protein
MRKQGNEGTWERSIRAHRQKNTSVPFNTSNTTDNRSKKKPPPDSPTTAGSGFTSAAAR